jgi:hypothetical protein
MRPLSRRLAALFCLAVLGILVLGGIVVGSLTGLVGLLGYAAVTGGLLGLAIARGRRLWQPAPLPAGRTCTCCTTSQHDPAEVV